MLFPIPCVCKHCPTLLPLPQGLPSPLLTTVMEQSSQPETFSQLCTTHLALACLSRWEPALCPPKANEHLTASLKGSKESIPKPLICMRFLLKSSFKSPRTLSFWNGTLTLVIVRHYTGITMHHLLKTLIWKDEMQNSILLKLTWMKSCQYTHPH